jgi:hypothetical protein
LRARNTAVTGPVIFSDERICSANYRNSVEQKEEEEERRTKNKEGRNGEFAQLRKKPVLTPHSATIQ